MKATLLISPLLVAACATGSRPYGQPDYELSQVRPYTASGARRPVSGPMVVLGALENLTVAPVGAELDSGGDLTCTYHYWALETKLRDELFRALRRHGVNVFRDDTDLGAPAPFPSPPFPAGLQLLRGSIERFGYSRHAQGLDVIVAELSLTLRRGDTGQVLWTDRKVFRFSTPSGQHDAFALLADAVALTLVQERRVGAALAANGGAR